MTQKNQSQKPASATKSTALAAREIAEDAAALGALATGGKIEGPLDFNALIGEGFTVAEDLVLEVGEGFIGVFRGPGEPSMMDDFDGAKDPETGLVKKHEVKTWRFSAPSAPNVEVALLGSAILDSRLARIPVGSMVAIQRGDKRKSKTSNRQVNEWTVAHRPPVVEAKTDEPNDAA